MSLAAAMWTHGNVVQPEFPERLSPRPMNQPFGDRTGFGSFFFGFNANNWFHFPMPTPVILNDVRPPLVKVFVFYATNARATITNLHVYDGKVRVKAFDGLALSGDHSGAIDAQNSWVIDPPVGIAFGLGLSVQVHFYGLDPDNPGNGEIQFVTAGADFASP